MVRTVVGFLAEWLRQLFWARSWWAASASWAVLAICFALPTRGPDTRWKIDVPGVYTGSVPMKVAVPALLGIFWLGLTLGLAIKAYRRVALRLGERIVGDSSLSYWLKVFNDGTATAMVRLYVRQVKRPDGADFAWSEVRLPAEVRTRFGASATAPIGPLRIEPGVPANVPVCFILWPNQSATGLLCIHAEDRIGLQPTDGRDKEIWMELRASDESGADAVAWYVIRQHEPTQYVIERGDPPFVARRRRLPKIREWVGRLLLEAHEARERSRRRRR